LSQGGKRRRGTGAQSNCCKTKKREKSSFVYSLFGCVGGKSDLRGKRSNIPGEEEEKRKMLNIRK